MMFACCVPMVAIVAALVLTGVVGLGWAIAAAVCVVLMPLMHAGSSHGHGGPQDRGP